MKHCRVLQIVSGVEIGKRSGGAELHSLQIARNLPQDEFEPAVFGLWSFGSDIEGRWVKTLNEEGIPVTLGAKRSGSLLRDLWATYRKLGSFVGNFKPDIVHSHSERTSLLASLTRLSNQQHPKAVRTVHLDKQWQTRPLFGILAEGITFPLLFSAEVAVSQAIAEMLRDRRLFGKGKISLCYNSIDDSAFHNESMDSQSNTIPAGMSDTRPRIGIVGRLTRQKGHDVLLNAAHRLKEVQEFQLIIVGDGPLQLKLQAQVRELNLEKHVQFLGVRDDVEAIMGHLDLFALPSRWEGFPTVILEAMAKNVPVVATDIPGTRELVLDGKTGWLVPVDNVEALATVMERILTDSEMAQHTAANAREYASNFTVSNMIHCYVRGYRVAIQK